MSDHELFSRKLKCKLIAKNDDTISVLEKALELVDGLEIVDFSDDTDRVARSLLGELNI